MHASVMQFLKSSLSKQEVQGRTVLEVGSAIYGKESPRDVILPLNPLKYIGIDNLPHKGVDLVLPDNWSSYFINSPVDIVICTEVLEHAKDWRSLVRQIREVLKPGGILILTCRAPGFFYHGYPSDYQRFSVNQISLILSDYLKLSVTPDTDPKYFGVFAKAIRSSELPSANLLSINPYPVTRSKNYSIIVPNKFEDVIQPLLTSLNQYESDPFHLVISADNHDRSYGYDLIKMSGPFVFSKSVNAGIKKVHPADVILLNDDIRLLQHDTFELLAQAAYKDPSIGILSPLIDGGCGQYQRPSNSKLFNKDGLLYCRGFRGNERLSFSCVYLKRSFLNKAGLFNERFTGYGYEDADMCIRAYKLGWKLAVTNTVTVQHGAGGQKGIRGSNWSLSFARSRPSGQKNIELLQSLHPELKRSIKN